ncbi:SH3 domain-containing protein [Pleurocapsa sp. PCC 7319]|uniref:SH3 domain-containing protein n=1 Tax=Pleurocapsa sp. PCC 7319 TaxID=118161 RepID=UPI00034D42E7|nr:SH3 domain-containing protein [Pleurocapsa sp. PCC 7319]
MAVVNLGIIRFLGLTSSLFLAMVLSVLAQSKSGWQDWQPVPSSRESLPFHAGFSNTELGSHLDYKDLCEQRANALDVSPTYWYRLSDLFWEIGTGEVEFGCQVEGQFVVTQTSRAIQVGLDDRVCLQVQSDFGNGLRVRQEPKISSRQVGTLRNGEEVFYMPPPALIITESRGRQWINVQQGELDAWVSLSTGEGEYVNFQLCLPDV